MQLKPIFDINQNINQTDYYWFQNGMSEEELLWIDNLKELYEFEKASIVGATSLNASQEVRNSRIKWIELDDKSLWLYQKLSNLIFEANNSIWGFNLHSIIDSIQYTEYLEGGGHYDWHVDIGPAPINHRKISIVVQLSDPTEYEGGDLEIWSGGSFQKVPKMKGCVVTFPSFLLHRVTPVTSGKRRSLVLWVGGDSYK